MLDKEAEAVRTRRDGLSVGRKKMGFLQLKEFTFWPRAG